MSATIRAAGVADAPWLAALAERTFRETYAAENTAENMERYVAEHFGVARQARELTDPAVQTLVADVSGEPAGYAQLVWSSAPPSVAGEAPIEITRFYVDRPWHGHGVAQLLMANLLQRAAAAGARTVWLGVWERNPRAIAFYRKSGFVEVGTHTFLLGTDPQRDFVLARPLP